MVVTIRAREPKSLWLVEGAGHVDLENYPPDAYRAHVLRSLPAPCNSGAEA
jgi:hypothetical protein